MLDERGRGLRERASAPSRRTPAGSISLLPTYQLVAPPFPQCQLWPGRIRHRANEVIPAAALTTV